MEAGAVLEDRRSMADAPAAETAAKPSNPYANGYMGNYANGTKRTAALWRRNRITPIDFRDSNFAVSQEAR